MNGLYRRGGACPCRQAEVLQKRKESEREEKVREVTVREVTVRDGNVVDERNIVNQ